MTVTLQNETYDALVAAAADRGAVVILPEQLPAFLCLPGWARVQRAGQTLVVTGLSHEEAETLLRGLAWAAEEDLIRRSAEVQ